MNINRGKKLLLVEDEVIISMITAKMLKQSGYNVVTANNGKKAVEIALADSSIDLILMDIDLGPGISGPEVARQILDTRDIPIVFLTSHPEQSVVESVKEITRYGYVIKNSGDFVLLSSIEMAFELFNSHARLKTSAENLRLSEERVSSKLDSILSPDGGVGELILGDVIDIKMLQSVMDDIFDMTGKSMAIIDLTGKVLISTGWQDICTKFHRVNPVSCSNCLESDTVLSQGIAEGSYKLYKCKNNMFDIATPVKIGGKHVGNLFIGQFLFDDEVVDYDLFRSQAKLYEFNEDEYISALDRVPRLGRDDVFTTLTFYIKFINIISKLSYSNIKLARTLAERDRYSELHKESEERLGDVTEYMADLVARLDEDNFYTYVSPSFERVLGYRPDDLVGTWAADIVHPASKEQNMEDVKDMCLKGEGLVELRLRHKNGTYRWFEVTGRSISSENGATAGGVLGARDITERKRTENVLKERDERYKRLFESVVGYVYTVFIENKSPVKTVHGPGCEALTGYTPEDFSNDPELWYRMIYPDDRGRVVLFASDIINRGIFNFIEHRIICRDGSMLWVRNTPVPHYDADNNLVEYDSIISDITERKFAETALKASEARYRLIVEKNPELILLLRNGKYIFANITGAEMLGFKSPEDIVGIDLSKTLSPEDMIEIKKREQRAINGEFNPPIELTFLRPDGTTCMTESASFPIDLPDGPAVLVMGKNITDRFVIGKKLRESESKFRAISENAPLGVYTTDKDGDCVYANRRWLEMAEFSFEEAAGKGWISAIHPDDRESVAEKWYKSVQSDGVWGYEYRFLSRSGKETWLHGNASAIYDEDGEISGYVGINIDITERRQSFDTINSLLKEKDLLLREVHHRIKNNMNTISSLLILQAASMSDEAAITALNDARSRVQGMMLMYDKLYRSEDYRKMNIKDYFENFIDDIFLIFESSRQITIIKDIEDFILDTKTIFPMGIVINELITNAFKYAFPDGRTGVIKISICKFGNEITLVVSDDGVGLSDEVVGSKSGGFGLSLVSALAEQLGGEVNISNDNGARVEIVFSVGV